MKEKFLCAVFFVLSNLLSITHFNTKLKKTAKKIGVFKTNLYICRRLSFTLRNKYSDKVNLFVTLNFYSYEKVFVGCSIDVIINGSICTA